MARIRTSRLAAWRVAATIALLAAAQPARAQLTTHTTEAAWLSAVSAPTLIDFAGLADGTPVTNQHAGLGFSAVNGGNPLAVADNFSQGGPNVLSLGTPPLTDGGSGVAIDFGAPQWQRELVVAPYSTLTLLARLRSLWTSVPLAQAV